MVGNVFDTKYITYNMIRTEKKKVNDTPILTTRKWPPGLRL